MATITLTKDNFVDTVKNNPIVLIDFWAEWCGPCRTFGPIFEGASDKRPNITFAKVDTEDQPELAQTFGIMSIPTLMVFRDEVILYAEPGALPEEALEDLVQKVEEVDMDEVRKAIAEQQEHEGHDHEGHDHDHSHAHGDEHNGHDHSQAEEQASARESTA